MASNRVMARRNFHRIWIAGKKTVIETGPWALNPSSADPEYKRDTNLVVTALINVLEISKLSADWAQSDMNFPTLF